MQSCRAVVQGVDLCVCHHRNRNSGHLYGGTETEKSNCKSSMGADQLFKYISIAIISLVFSKTLQTGQS